MHSAGVAGSIATSAVKGGANPAAFRQEKTHIAQLAVQRRSGNALRCPDCHHEYCCSISVAAILTLPYGQSLRGDHWIHGRRDGRSRHRSHPRQPFFGIPPRLPGEASRRAPQAKGIPGRKQCGHGDRHLPPGRQWGKVQGRDRSRTGSAAESHRFGFSSGGSGVTDGRGHQGAGTGKAAHPRRGAHRLLARFSDDQGSGWHLRTDPALRAGVHQDRNHRQGAGGQRGHDALSRAHRRHGQHDRPLHGRSGNHQPGAGHSRRAVYLPLPPPPRAKRPLRARLPRAPLPTPIALPRSIPRRASTVSWATPSSTRSLR